MSQEADLGLQHEPPGDRADDSESSSNEGDLKAIRSRSKFRGLDESLGDSKANERTALSCESRGEQFAIRNGTVRHNFYDTPPRENFDRQGGDIQVDSERSASTTFYRTLAGAE